MIENIAIQPATAEVQARIRASFERQGLMRHLGACLSDIGHGQVRIKRSRIMGADVRLDPGGFDIGLRNSWEEAR
jgi:hypothetical protein